MKHSFLRIAFAGILFLLIFYPGKVFSMDWLFGRTENPAQNGKQVRWEESRTDAGSEDDSSSESRGILGPNDGPSESRVAAQGYTINTFAGESDEEHYFLSSNNLIVFRQDAYYYLRLIENDRAAAENAFTETGMLSKYNPSRGGYELALKIVKRSIDSLKETLQEAEAKAADEQASSFEAAFQEACAKHHALHLQLESMIEDVTYISQHSADGIYLSSWRNKK